MASPSLCFGFYRSSDLAWLLLLALWLALTTAWYSSRSHPPELQSSWISNLPLPPIIRHSETARWINATMPPPSPSPLQDWRNAGPSSFGDGPISNVSATYGPQPSRSAEANEGENAAGRCASVEEMGVSAAGNVVSSSLRLRRLIDAYLSEHGAVHVRELPAKDFCSRGFVFGRAGEDGLGNEIYKILTAAGLGVMLNRSLIIAEHGSVNPAYFQLPGSIRLPFGDYLNYSNQAFSVSEVKWLWVKHNCTGTFHRPLIMRIDDFQKPTRTRVLCEDWTAWKHPVIWFRGTTDSNALQFFLKNRHPIMQSSAALLFGNNSQPDSRPNAFGELFKAFISPMPVIDEAVKWVLQGAPNPDVSVHLRMLNSRAKAPSYAMSNCIKTMVKNMPKKKAPLQVVVVTDTSSIISSIKGQVEGFSKVIHFDYGSFIKSYHNLSKVMGDSYFQPPEKRVKDWGSMPRWVAIVDLFLAARAKYAVISGANRRVGTTYAQLLAALTAAMRTDDEQGETGTFKFYSSFQSSLLVDGLAGQRGWGHTWRRFGGNKSCKNQRVQCALTPLLPYAWWDGPWESPVPRDIQRMLAYGVKISGSGQVDLDSLTRTCSSRRVPIEVVWLALPSCKKLKLCH